MLERSHNDNCHTWAMLALLDVAACVSPAAGVEGGCELPWGGLILVLFPPYNVTRWSYKILPVFVIIHPPPSILLQLTP